MEPTYYWKRNLTLALASFLFSAQTATALECQVQKTCSISLECSPFKVEFELIELETSESENLVLIAKVPNRERTAVILSPVDSSSRWLKGEVNGEPMALWIDETHENFQLLPVGESEAEFAAGKCGVGLTRNENLTNSNEGSGSPKQRAPIDGESLLPPPSSNSQNSD
ncbi:hypothetical protein [Pseudophaeobacter sp.]|jgi:hypothetical protein|uniref:hypothetical protein n=1 Tax=Pseudophaeobacter sp. TaxID=1971739 RepID=UPI0025F2C643|nr:hypothetical protein [uncultured Pseudophaeobacter sp.]